MNTLRYTQASAPFKQLILLMAVLLITNAINAQTKYQNYTWDENPAMTNVDTLELKDGAVILKEKRIMEVFANPEDRFEEMHVFHQKVKVTTSAALDRFNKIYIALKDVLEIIDIKARFISASGKITELPQESIKEVENLENKGNYKIFAIEGAEVGGEIEYYYILRKSFDAYQGIFIQGKIPKYKVEVVLAYPELLEYDIRSYNSFPEFNVIAKSENSEKLTEQSAYIDYMPALSEERYGYYDCHRMRYEYTMAYNNYRGVLRSYSWAKAGERYLPMYEFTKKEMQAIRSVVSKEDNKKLPMRDRIRNLENWMKTENQLDREIPRMELDKAIELKQISPYDATRLMIGFCQEIAADFELVLTCKNEDRNFDPTYNAWNYLFNFCIYFPEIDDFLVPGEVMSRLGVRSVSYMANYGLFLKPISYNEDVSTLAYDVKQLPSDGPFINIDSMHVKLNIDTDELTVDAVFDRTFKGLLAQQFQSFWNMVVDEERKEEIITQLFNMGDEQLTINAYELKNSSPEDIAVKPLIWNVNQTADALIEVAGEDLIVHIGKVIGQQAEMYQESERKLPVSVGFLHTYYRNIELQIPDGYVLENPESLNMEVVMNYQGKESCAFLSHYTVEGNVLTIHSEEYYRDYHYPVEEFEPFRDVVNAAANFNKRTILLKKAD